MVNPFLIQLLQRNRLSDFGNRGRASQIARVVGCALANPACNPGREYTSGDVTYREPCAPAIAAALSPSEIG